MAARVVAVDYYPGPRPNLDIVSGEKKRGFWWVVSDLRGGLDADERVEVAVACL